MWCSPGYCESVRSGLLHLSNTVVGRSLATASRPIPFIPPTSRPSIRPNLTSSSMCPGSLPTSVLSSYLPPVGSGCLTSYCHDITCPSPC
ncbi:hypothetical protein LY76DRAFT_87628 [Colletotrichum caudatum]|nr:hypothetical protein LY76DRAFT_87628 [Colletotrichum caudatum]